jgi:hypothetical protein
MSAGPQALLALLPAVMLVAAGMLWWGAHAPSGGLPADGALGAERRLEVDGSGTRAAVETEQTLAASRTEAAPAAPDTRAEPTTPAAPGTVRGRLAGAEPGYGAAWVLEAYRVTASRSTVVEHRRAFVEPAGSFAFESLAAGTWQLAVVSPAFAWGPLVEVAAGAVADGVVLPRESTGGLRVEMIPAAHWQRDARVRLEVWALQSPALEGETARVRVPVAAREARIGEPCVLEGMASGRFEVTATLLSEPPPGWEPARARAEVAVRPGETAVELWLSGSV